jgi:hypothetical protein
MSNILRVSERDFHHMNRVLSKLTLNQPNHVSDIAFQERFHIHYQGTRWFDHKIAFGVFPETIASNEIPTTPNSGGIAKDYIQRTVYMFWREGFVVPIETCPATKFNATHNFSPAGNPAVNIP